MTTPAPKPTNEQVRALIAAREAASAAEQKYRDTEFPTVEAREAAYHEVEFLWSKFFLARKPIENYRIRHPLYQPVIEE